MTRSGRRLLLVTGEHMIAYRWDVGRLVDAVTFTADGAGRLAFSRYLAESPDLPNRLLLDLVEEEFRIERLPHVPGERRQLLERTAAKLFRATPFRHWSVQGREEQGRRDDRVLFSAVTNPEPVRPWLDLLHAAKAPLVAIGSIPYLSEQLLQPLGIESRHVLLVSKGRYSGLRQTYLRDGCLSTSRLSPGNQGDGVDQAAFVADEIGKTIRYLQHLQLLAFDDMLSVYVLSDDTRLEFTPGPLGETVRITPVSIAVCARKLALDDAGAPFADALFAQFALRGRARNSYAEPRERRYARHRRARQTLRWGAGLLLAVGLVASAQNLMQWRLGRQAAGQMEAQTVDYRRLADATIDDDAPPGIDARQMRDAVTTVDALRAVPMVPERLLSHLGRVLGEYAEFRVDRLRWTAGSREAALADLDEAPASDSRAEEDLAAEKGMGAGVYHTALIEGRVEPFAGDYRRALSRLDALLASLRESVPGVVQVAAIRRPLDISSTGSLAGDSAPTRAEAPYAVHIVVKADE